MIFYNDPGHGWLRVPLRELKELGIEKQISGYSYVDAEYVYLEEDADAGIYLTAKFKVPEVREAFVKTIESVYHEDSWIRNLDHYTMPIDNKTKID